MQIMMGIGNTNMEFSMDRNTLEESWKYRVTEGGLNVNIEYLEKHDGEWVVKEETSISKSCAEALFTSVATAMTHGAFTKIW